MSKRSQRFFSVLFVVLSTGGGLALADFLCRGVFSVTIFGVEVSSQPWLTPTVYFSLTLLFMLASLFLRSLVINGFSKLIRSFLHKLNQLSLIDLFFCALGLITGMVIASLLCNLVSAIPIKYLAFALNIVSYVVLSYLGLSIVYKRLNDIPVAGWLRRKAKDSSDANNNQELTTTKQYPEADKPKSPASGYLKLLDTSAIIDGRIGDICKTRFVDGVLIVPSFVLDELRHIADSPEQIKRVRGRRGLDVLAKMQNENNVVLNVVECDYPDVNDVDVALLRMAIERNASIITTDYNLNKIAAVQHVPVLNINDLANAIKSVLLPGEELDVIIVKEGKEREQGLAYLDDGTMIVVDNGKSFVGKSVRVCVTSALQTSAGRMVFASIV